jgi:hypothetical protein
MSSPIGAASLDDSLRQLDSGDAAPSTQPTHPVAAATANRTEQRRVIFIVFSLPFVAVRRERAAKRAL